MLVSLNFVETFLSLPKIETQIVVNHKKISTKIFDTTAIAEILTRQGFEVDSITTHGEKLNHVVVGKIESVQPHPTSEKLQICFVDVGEENLRQIVCGAKNARAGLFVAVALPGTTLPSGLEIKPSTIRDVESHGMLCARDELGLVSVEEWDGTGIWELSEKLMPFNAEQKLDNLCGVPLFKALGLYDVLLDISVTPNRPDMLCHVGVARELEAGFAFAQIPCEKRSPHFIAQHAISAQKIKDDATHHNSVQLNNWIISADNDLNIPAFFLILDSVVVAPSPFWLRNLLEVLGQSSINNVVDASNYILLAYGQPSHAFDVAKINPHDETQKKIHLRAAQAQESFAALDGKTRQLHEADCVVSDDTVVHALLGVVGGELSKVTAQTQAVAVEFANPHPVAVRRTSRRHGRQTDASFMFEKGIDAAARFDACRDFLSLLNAISAQEVSYVSTIHSKNAHSQPLLETNFPQRTVSLHKDNQAQILGAEILSFQEQKSVLHALGFQLFSEDAHEVVVRVPHWREHDIAGTADLIEECIRIVGIDKVPPQPLLSTTQINKDDPHFSFLEKLSAQCASLGYNEVIGLHFMRADDFEKWNFSHINQLGEPIAVLNPIIGDEPLLHNTLLPDLLRKVNKNLNYGVKCGQLFHSCRTFQNTNAQGQRVFLENGHGTEFQDNLSTAVKHILAEYSYEYGYEYSHEKEKLSRPVETPRLGGVLFGAKQEKTWQNSGAIAWSLHDIMAHVIELARCVGVSLNALKMGADYFHPVADGLHPGRRVGFFVTLNDATTLPIGFCGEVHPKVMRNYDIGVPCFVFEINVANLMRAASLSSQFTKRSIATQKFPTVQRDFAFLLDDSITAQKIHEAVASSLSTLIPAKIPVTLKNVHVFDIYKGAGIVVGKKSLTFKVSLEPTERTLTEKDITALSQQIVFALEELGGQLRG